jgi:hypothetical protein
MESSGLPTRLRDAVLPIIFVLIGVTLLAGATYYSDKGALALAWASAGAATVIYGLSVDAATKITHIPLIGAYGEIKAFFQSAVFYIMLGCMFLFTAYYLLDRSHSAFVFLLAILGIAIVLYGTGTQAAGTGRTGDDKVGPNMNIAIAGGAGVLAAFFGFGVLHYQRDLAEVFKHNYDYGVLQLARGNQGQSISLSDFDITANLPDGRSLPLWKDKNSIHIMVPIYSESVPTDILVQVKQRSSSPADLNTDPVPYTVNWSNEVRRVRDVANNILLVKTNILTLTKTTMDARNPVADDTLNRLMAVGQNPPRPPVLSVSPQ